MVTITARIIATLIIAAALALCQHSHGQTVQTPTARTIRVYHADFGNWLTISFSGEQGDQWHPNWTNVVCVYKPVVRRLPQGRWEITFTDELTEALP